MKFLSEKHKQEIRKKILKKEITTQNFPIIVKCFGVLLVDKYVP